MPPKKRFVGPRGTRLEQRYLESGMIQPGAHPERGKVKPLGNPIEQVGGLIRRMVRRKAPKK